MLHTRLQNRHTCLLILGLLISLTASGAARGDVIRIEENAGSAPLELRAQSAAGVEIRYAMREFSLDAVDQGGETLEKVSLPGCFMPNNAGAPDLPGFGRFIAIPRGAVARVTILHAETRTYTGVDLPPAAPLQKEDDPIRAKVTKDPAIYGRRANYPESPVSVSEPKELRGVRTVTLGITPFQYNPVNRVLTVYTRLDIQVDFIGGSGEFADNRLRNRYWESLLRDQILNYETLPPIDFNNRASGGNRYGFEYVIITADNATCVAWADSIKAWRIAQGISTEVFTTAQTGVTAAQIESWLNNAYTTWDVPPVAFLILGDSPGTGLSGSESEGTDEPEGTRENLPGVYPPLWGSIASDNIYADVSGDDLPDMAHGRICAKTDLDLARMVGKMLSYERSPVMDPGFYDHPLFVGCWETERWTVLCDEVVLGHQERVLGKHPGREYGIYSGSPGEFWSTGPNTPTVVNYFGPNGLGYIPQTPSHLTDWNGDYVGINNAINSGAYFVLARTHGYENRWAMPLYNTGHIALLTNTMYPFVFAINCNTGRYTWAYPCFTEVFHRSPYGAVGVIAASSGSYAFVNDALTWGMFDSMWPGFDPGYGYGGTQPTILRPGFAHVYGKYYLEASTWPFNSGSKVETYHLFHYHGDVFLTMHDQVPTPPHVVHADHLEPGEATFTVEAEDGALIGLTVGGEIVGVADGTGAPLPIPIIPQAGERNDLRVVVTKADRLRYDVRIPIEARPVSASGDRFGTSDADVGTLTSRMFPARPNPFVQSTRISYVVPAAGLATLLQVYDASGRLVRTLVDGVEAPGEHIAIWDGADGHGREMPSGTYYYQLSVGAEEATRRMILLR